MRFRVSYYEPKEIIVEAKDQNDLSRILYDEMRVSEVVNIEPLGEER